MRAEVIAIGDELTSGQRLDTNSRWLSRRLSDLGIKTIRHTTVGDELDVNVDAFQHAAGTADFVVVTGGLGPTLDDLTRQSLATAFDAPLQLDGPSLEHIRTMFASRNREMPERNRIQAMFPEGGLVIPNPHGSAPGIDMTVNFGDRPCRFFALPGVPAEMQQMWDESVQPRIEEQMGSDLGALRFHALKIFGIGESDVEVKLPDLIRRDRDPAVGITVSRATITLRMATRALSDDDFQSRIASTVEEVQAALGDMVFGTDLDELEHAVLRLLNTQNLKMATLEIGAGGWLADWLSKADESRGVVVGCLSVPSLEAAGSWLEEATTEELTLELLAEQLQRRFHCQVALVLGAYPTQSEMQLASTPFTFSFAVRVGQEMWSIVRSMGGHPDVLGPRIAKTGLDLARRALAGLPLD